MQLVKATRPPLQPSERTPILVMLHGIGSDERDLLGLAPMLDPRLHLVAYRAPRPYGSGYSWFDITWDGITITFNESQAAESLAALALDIASLVSDIEQPQLYVGGFSQGAAMTLGLLPELQSSLSGALVLSGRKSESLVLPDLEGLPVLVQHGLYDNVIPVENGHRIRDDLAAAEAEVTYREYAMGHEVSTQSLADLGEWLAKHLRQS